LTEKGKGKKKKKKLNNWGVGAKRSKQKDIITDSGKRKRKACELAGTKGLPEGKGAAGEKPS